MKNVVPYMIVKDSAILLFAKRLRNFLQLKRTSKAYFMTWRMVLSYELNHQLTRNSLKLVKVFSQNQILATINTLALKGRMTSREIHSFKKMITFRSQNLKNQSHQSLRNHPTQLSRGKSLNSLHLGRKRNLWILLLICWTHRYKMK